MVIRYIAALWQWFGRQGYPCLFRLLTGLYCPGCGGTRALKCLLQGKVLTSLYYNPLIVYMAVVGAVETGLWAADRLRETEGGAGKEAAGKGEKAEVKPGAALAAEAETETETGPTAGKEAV